jgi:hypothetical protein
MTNSKFAELANNAAKYASEISGAVRELSVTQQETLKKITNAKAGFKARSQQIDGEQKVAIKFVNDTYKAERDALKKEMVEFEKEAKDELIAVGLKAEDINLTETAAVKKADEIVSVGLGGFGKGLNYIKTKIQAGMKK